MQELQEHRGTGSRRVGVGSGELGLLEAAASRRSPGGLVAKRSWSHVPGPKRGGVTGQHDILSGSVKGGSAGIIAMQAEAGATHGGLSHGQAWGGRSYGGVMHHELSGAPLGPSSWAGGFISTPFPVGATHSDPGAGGRARCVSRNPNRSGRSSRPLCARAGLTGPHSRWKMLRSRSPPRGRPNRHRTNHRFVFADGGGATRRGKRDPDGA